MAEPNAGNKVNIEKVPFTCYFGASVIGNELRARALEQMSGTDRERLLSLNDLDRLEVSLAGANAAAVCEVEESCFVADKGNIKGAAAIAVFDDMMKGSFKVVGPLDDSRVQQMQEWADQHCRVATSRSVAGNTVKNEETVSCSSEPVGGNGGTFSVKRGSHSTSGYATGGAAGSRDAFDKIAKGIRERHDRAADRIEKDFDQRAAEIHRGYAQTADEIKKRYDETKREIDRRFDETEREIDRRFDGTERAIDAKETSEETLARLSGDMASALVAAGETTEDALRLIADELAGYSGTASKLQALERMAEMAGFSGYGDKLAKLKGLPRFSKDAKALGTELKTETVKVKSPKDSPFARRVIAINSLYERYIGIK